MKLPKFMVNILDKIAPSNLEHLSVSNNFAQEMVQIIPPNLQHIILLDAWKNHAFLNLNTLQPFSHLLQLHLAEPPPKQRDEFQNDDFIQNIWQHNLSTRIFGYGTHPPSWGSELRHLRIDQIDFRALRIDSIDSPDQGLKNLRVLVLRPPPTKIPGRWTWILERESYPNDPFGPPLPAPAQMLSLPEAVIARVISTQDLPCLRLIAVGKYRFWVHHNIRTRKHSRTKKPKKPTLWFLRHALQDKVEEKLVLRTIIRKDWEFLGDKAERLETEAAAEEKRGASRGVFYSGLEGFEY